jgi:hypothetical protein
MLSQAANKLFDLRLGHGDRVEKSDSPTVSDNSEHVGTLQLGLHGHAFLRSNVA